MVKIALLFGYSLMSNSYVNLQKCPFFFFPFLLLFLLHFPVIASSGIDYDIKLWSPLAEENQFDEDVAHMVRLSKYYKMTC